MIGNDDFIFDFERLEVYKKALKFSNEIFNLSFSRELQYSLGKQFRRAALSICNNIAEGSRKYGKAKAQFYHYALDSTRECIPMISLSLFQKQVDEDKSKNLRFKCIEISRMLYRLTESIK